MMLIEKIAQEVAVHGDTFISHAKKKKMKKPRKWLSKNPDDPKTPDLDGQDPRGFEGKGGGFHNMSGMNTGGITFTGQGSGYRRAT